MTGVTDVGARRAQPSGRPMECADSGDRGGPSRRRRLMMLTALSVAYLIPLPAQTAMQLLEVQRITAKEQDLSVVALVSRGSDGTIWISQPQDHNVAGFSTEGRRIRTIGRRGEGPGSFGGPPAGLIPSNGALAVFDAQLQRITRFDRPGSGITTTSIIRPAGLPGPSRTTLISAGPKYVLYLSGNLPRLIGTGRGTGPARAEIHRAAVDGSGLHLLATFDYRSCGLGRQSAGGLRQVSIPFCHRAHYGASPTGSYFGIAEPVELERGVSAIDLRIYAATGDLLSESRHELGVSIIPKHSADSVVTHLRQRITDPEGTSILNEIVKGGHIPSTYPPVTSITVSEDGEAWVTTRSGPRGTPGVLVVRRDGSLRGRIALTSGSRIGWAGDNHVLIVEELPDGLQDVVLYRIAAQ